MRPRRRRDRELSAEARFFHGAKREPRATFAIAANSDGSTRKVLHTGDMRPVTHGDFTVNLVELTPYPFSARPIEPSDYRVTLRLAGN